MPNVTIGLLKGNVTVDKKREIAKVVTDVLLKTTGAPPHAVNIVFYDIAPDNLAVAGELFIDRK